MMAHRVPQIVANCETGGEVTAKRFAAERTV
ncbi:hypothetical protein F441_18038 [Phytophthora nicotianae CJ01A1]|uniref:Uncharacterized protein n=4 Tax=Phytophthora nicotianae TaxID=4792 RepID=V9E935_PHYNI|nr:hypothetical protein F443_18173 [Phytophthora nicotianae P1569]ETK75735.1 hypothetical protein L915_17692 [Phytophthora nicotianae]ETP05319.1 hypothetical protein F441_18038 [Phytophthora nicotianae CJ01A1]ETP33447.1 hypothetical protein F442_18013 [Phytophthora nicotianae P10297]ETL29177.1 hypothetical protein L916_17580 [Phytophthora nicotianae]